MENSIEISIENKKTRFILWTLCSIKQQQHKAPMLNMYVYVMGKLFGKSSTMHSRLHPMLRELCCVLYVCVFVCVIYTLILCLIIHHIYFSSYAINDFLLRYSVIDLCFHLASFIFCMINVATVMFRL